MTTCLELATSESVPLGAFVFGSWSFVHKSPIYAHCDGVMIRSLIPWDQYAYKEFDSQLGNMPRWNNRALLLKIHSSRLLHRNIYSEMYLNDINIYCKILISTDFYKLTESFLVQYRVRSLYGLLYLELHNVYRSVIYEPSSNLTLLCWLSHN